MSLAHRIDSLFRIRPPEHVRCIVQPPIGRCVAAPKPHALRPACAKGRNPGPLNPKDLSHSMGAGHYRGLKGFSPVIAQSDRFCPASSNKTMKSSATAIQLDTHSEQQWQHGRCTEVQKHLNAVCPPESDSKLEFQCLIDSSQSSQSCASRMSLPSCNCLVFRFSANQHLSPIWTVS